MSSMNISLPAALKAFVDKRVKSGDYGTSSEYLRELIRHDKSRVELKKLINEGLDSPIAGPPDKAFWARMRTRAGIK